MIYNQQPPKHLAVENPRDTAQEHKEAEPQQTESPKPRFAITIKDDQIGDFATLAKRYENLALSMFGRWVCAMGALALAAVVLTKDPKPLLKSAAIYTIAISAIHIPFVGFPMVRPASSTNASVPRWYKMTLAVMHLLWIPTIVIMLYCYKKRHNYDDPEKNREHGWSSIHARRIRAGGSLRSGHSGSSDPLDNFALGAGVAGIAAFLACFGVWLQVSIIQWRKWDPQATADVHAGKMRENAWKRDRTEL